MGVACYADDVVLIAPCRQAMQMMLNTVKDFADIYNISFSTDPQPKKSKSKCIFMVGRRRGLSKPVPLMLGEHQLPWVDSAIHLGHTLHESGTMDQDAVVKRAEFIDKSVEVRTMFRWAAPIEVLTALKVYCSDFYGCMLWDLGGDKASQVYSAWNTAVKLTWSCPRWTKTFLVQQVLASGSTSAETDILARYGNFSKGLRTSRSQEVRVLFNLVSRDLQSTTRKKLKHLGEKSGLDPWTTSSIRLKTALHEKQMVEISAQDTWRIAYLTSLLGQLQEAKSLVEDDRARVLQGLIDSLVR